MECSRGWDRRCGDARSTKCRCACGGLGHGKARRQLDLFAVETPVPRAEAIAAPRPADPYRRALESLLARRERLALATQERRS